MRWNDTEERLLVHKREPGDIWQGLYELPLLETEKPIPLEALEATIGAELKARFGAEPSSLQVGPTMTHKLTHRTIQAQFLQAKYAFEPPQIPKNIEIAGLSQTKSLPISRLIDRYLSKLWISLSHQLPKKYYLCNIINTHEKAKNNKKTLYH